MFFGKVFGMLCCLWKN